MNGVTLAFTITWALAMPPASILLQDSPQPVKSTGSCCSEAYREGGWSIPGALKAKVLSRSAVRQTAYVAEQLQPSPRVLWIETISCSAARGRIEVKRQRVEVLLLVRLSVKGRSYAYQVTVSPLQASGDRGGDAYVYYYFDPDGSGVFSMIREAGPIADEPFAPDWAKRMAEAKEE